MIQVGIFEIAGMKYYFTSLLILTFVFCGQGQTTQSDDCVRAIPEPIIKNQVFPKTSFKLVKGKSYPFESVGYEKVQIKDGLNLTIINSGCENYTLTFRFEVSNLSHNIKDANFWYGKAVELMLMVKKGIRSQDTGLITKGTNAINSYIKKNRELKYENYIDFGGSEIRDVVVVDKVKKQGLKKYQIEISYSIGPL
ncbi:MAG: hypothetical protein ACR2L1_06230 [Pyrinomonadaceae bacterium]